MNSPIHSSAASPPTAHASPATLAKASISALVVAAAVTVLFVIPAETGDDPTGVGKALGIAGMSAGDAPTETIDTTAKVDEEAQAPAGPAEAAAQAKSAWREDAQKIVLPPYRGTEMKARMKAGDGYSFDWKSDGAVMVDMHGDPPNAGPDDFTSYWEQAETTSQAGTFVAPFDGIHGWYWRNLTDKPVTVELKISGHYEDLYKP
ncbi:hypothetical protein [Croceicoccus sediminis]|uniref:hypothetical protein n=1 Tax=Croceicoccus sediminis TaxID=2571150 RepID=UPI001182D2A5|nr:hypothetical protein [Croceicoccus sediminis]